MVTPPAGRAAGRAAGDPVVPEPRVGAERPERPRGRARRGLARLPRHVLVVAGWGSCAASLSLMAAMVAMLAVWRDLLPGELGPGIVEVLALAGVPVVGAVIVARLPYNPYGWVWSGLALSLASSGVADVALVGMPDSFALAWVLPLLYGMCFTVFLLLVVMVFLLFPDGRPPSPRWRWVLRAGLVTAAVIVLVLPFAPSWLDQPRPVSSVTLSGAAGQVLLGVLDVAVGGLFVLILVSTTAVPVRWRRAGPVERQQLKWFALGAVWFAVGAVLSAFVVGTSPRWLNAALNVSMLGGTSAAVAVAMLRYRLYAVDRVINRTLLYGGLSAALGVVYVTVVVLTPVLLADDVPGLGQALATAAVALLVLPIRSRLQRAVDRLTFGHRGDPYAVLAELGRRLQAAAAAEDVLPGLVTSLAETLRLPYVAIDLQRDGAFERGACYGRPLAEPVVFPLAHSGQPVGRLLVSPRSPREDLAGADRRLLADLAGQAGAAVYAVRLADDLRRSRARVVAAREEERRRLRRDLHDGLGPALAAVALGLDTARRRCTDRPDRAAVLLGQLSASLQEAIADVRRLVHDLRPPVLDQLGLVDAIRAEARQFETDAAAGGVGLLISVDAPDVAPAVPAAVEVAAYRIAGEALTNVVRHAHAHRCLVRLAFDSGLEVEVRDDGHGLPEAPRCGVGLTAMSERAAEVGGSCSVTSTRGGTQVLARLPLEPAP